MTKSILILGGCGLIGQEIAKRYYNEGWNTYIWDNKSNPYIDYTDDKLVGYNIFDIYDGSLFALLDNVKFDVISNQASLVSVGESQYQIQKYMDNNIGIVSELMQAMIDTNNFPEFLFHASSMGIYGDTLISEDCSLLEDSVKIPASFYGISKHCQEEMFRVFSDLYNVKTIALRYFSVYGNINPLNPLTGIISVIVNKFLNSDVVELNDDGGQTRDFVHAEDISNLHYSLMNKPEVISSNFNFFNVCTGGSHSLKEIAYYIKGVLQSNKEIVFNNKTRKGDIYYSRGASELSILYPDFKYNKNLYEEIAKYIGYVLKNKDKFTVGYDSCKKADEKLKEKGLF